MKLVYKIKYILLAAFFVFTACEDKSDLTAPGKPETGNVDFTTFVSIGNSLTAGYQSGSLYKSAQEYSFGNLIAKQVMTEYQQPLYSDPGTAGRLEVGSLDPFVIKVNTKSGTPLNSNYSKSYNNLGIPGALLYDVLNATSSTTCIQALSGGDPNPMFDLVLRGKGTQIQQALSLNPTFITLWIGNNDILGHATSGGILPYTPQQQFEQLYNALVAQLASTNAKVAVANIPDVTTIPFFTTVGFSVGAAIKDGLGTAFPAFIYQKHGETVASGQVTDVNQLFGMQVLLTLRGSSYATLIGQPTDKYYTDNNLPVPAGIDVSKPFGLHPQNPWPDALILDSDELSTVQKVISDYNNIISNAVSTNSNFVLVDINALLKKVAAGLVQDGVNFSTQFVHGYSFSLDGVHPSSQGYGLVANEFIKAINNKFGAKIPLVNIATIPGSLVLGKKESNIMPVFEKGALDNILF